MKFFRLLIAAFIAFTAITTLAGPHRDPRDRVGIRPNHRLPPTIDRRFPPPPDRRLPPPPNRRYPPPPIDRHWPDSRWADHNQRFVCTASDRGWEEHWSGHGDCRSCLAVHGECIETCESIRNLVVCDVQGSTLSGRTENFQAEGFDRWNAESNAELRCFRSGYRDCRPMGCRNSQDREVVSRQSCRR